MKLTVEERAALLRVRYAERYEKLGQPPSKNMASEVAEEQVASCVVVKPAMWLSLRRRGFLTPTIPMKLTDKGREALQ